MKSPRRPGRTNATRASGSSSRLWRILEVDDAGASAGETPIPSRPGTTTCSSTRTASPTSCPWPATRCLRPAPPAVEEAFRTGGGVEDRLAARGLAQEGANRLRLLRHLLGSEWLPAVEDVHERLEADPPATVADAACGAGWSSIAMARAYPKVTVDGFDVDEASVEPARARTRRSRTWTTGFASNTATPAIPELTAATTS